jgi:hypothetical protein
MAPVRAPARLALALAAGLWQAACAHPAPPPAPAPHPSEPSPEVYRRAEEARVKLLEHEIERLNADVAAAEETLVSVESGLRGSQTRTEAVSMLAEARIEVDRAEKRAPWRADAAAEAQEKLEEADRQIAQNHIGSAIFFISRASRIAKNLLAEADLVRKTPGTRFVRSDRVNLRAAPDAGSEVLAVLRAELPVFAEGDEGEWVLVRTVRGDVGWVHASLLRAR